MKTVQSSFTNAVHGEAAGLEAAEAIAVKRRLSLKNNGIGPAATPA